MITIDYNRGRGSKKTEIILEQPLMATNYLGKYVLGIYCCYSFIILSLS